MFPMLWTIKDINSDDRKSFEENRRGNFKETSMTITTSIMKCFQFNWFITKLHFFQKIVQSKSRKVQRRNIIDVILWMQLYMRFCWNCFSCHSAVLEYCVGGILLQLRVLVVKYRKRGTITLFLLYCCILNPFLNKSRVN